jgi:hypothetical protein
MVSTALSTSSRDRSYSVRTTRQVRRSRFRIHHEDDDEYVAPVAERRADACI